MDLKEWMIDTVFGENMGDKYRAKKFEKEMNGVKDKIIKILDRKDAEEERRHRELIEAIRQSGGRKDR